MGFWGHSWNWDQKRHGETRAWKEPILVGSHKDDYTDDDYSGEKSGKSSGKSNERSREAELDIQYEEAPDKRWASIPRNERLPCDRAAPCLAHLLL